MQCGRPGLGPWEDPLEKEMATHSSILAWRIPWREAWLQSMGSQRVRHDWATDIFNFRVTEATYLQLRRATPPHWTRPFLSLAIPFSSGSITTGSPPWSLASLHVACLLLFLPQTLHLSFQTLSLNPQISCSDFIQLLPTIKMAFYMFC